MPSEKNQEAITADKPERHEKTLEEYAAERQHRLAQGERPVAYAGGVSFVRTRG